VNDERPHHGRRFVLVLWFIACWVAPTAVRAQDDVGSLRGTVTDADSGAPLGSVTVSVIEALLSLKATPDGFFLFPRVPPGTYTLVFSRDGYERKVIASVVVTARALTDVQAELTTEAVEMEEFVVHGLELSSTSDLGCWRFGRKLRICRMRSARN